MDAFHSFDDDAWDEERWEAFLRDHDKRVDHYMELLFRFMRKYPQPDPEEVEAFAAWKASLRTWLRERGWQHEDMILRLIWLGEEQAEEDADDEAAFLLDGSTAFADEEDTEGTFEALERLPVYQEACALSNQVLDWAHALASEVKDSRLAHFCAHVAQVPAHLAQGYGIGHERETLGGNIACAKRALADANAALTLLARMKRAPYMDAATYRLLYEQAYEVRNAVALYVQHLRERFNLGID